MREKKTDKRKLQGAETKKRLYEIAEKMILEDKYTDINVEEITDEAGVTKGAFYVHYESKDALIAMIISDYVARTDADYKTYLDTLPEGLPAKEVLLALTSKITDTILNNIGYDNMKKVYQVLLAGNVDTEGLKGYGRELYSLFCGVLDKGIRSGEFQSELSVETLSRHFVTAIRGICFEWCVRYPNFDLREQTVEHIKLLTEGIKAHRS